MPAVVAVEVHAVLYARDAEIAPHALSRLGDSLLLQARQVSVAFFPCGVNFVAGGRRRAGKSENRSHRARIERWIQFLRRSNEHLESDFLLSCLHLPHHRY